MIDPAYTKMLASARQHPEQWRIFVILAVGLFVTMIATPFVFLGLGAAAPELNTITTGRAGVPRVGVTPGGAFVVLASFVVMIGATKVTASHLHRRSMRDLTGPAKKLRADFMTCLKGAAVLSVVMFLLPWETGDLAFERQYTVGQWLFWLPFAVLALMIQVTAEELLFRGYLQTQITGATGSVRIGIFFSALVFGLGHFSMSGGESAFFPVFWAMAFGVVAGDLTARTGSLGPAIALHLINNATAMLAAPHEDMLSGFGLFVRQGEIAAAYTDPLVMALECIHLLLLWLVARVVLRR